MFWQPYLEGELRAIIFVASLNCFDQYFEEDGKNDGNSNRMYDQISLYGKIFRSSLLLSVPVILFLNKVDLSNAIANLINNN